MLEFCIGLMHLAVSYDMETVMLISDFLLFSLRVSESLYFSKLLTHQIFHQILIFFTRFLSKFTHLHYQTLIILSLRFESINLNLTSPINFQLIHNRLYPKLLQFLAMNSHRNYLSIHIKLIIILLIFPIFLFFTLPFIIIVP